MCSKNNDLHQRKFGSEKSERESNPLSYLEEEFY